MILPSMTWKEMGSHWDRRMGHTQAPVPVTSIIIIALSVLMLVSASTATAARLIATAATHTV